MILDWCSIYPYLSNSHGYPARVLNKPLRFETYNSRVLVSAGGAGSVHITDSSPSELSPPVRLADGSMTFHLATLQGIRFQILTSTNLLDWEVWKDFTAEEETAELVAPDVATETMRFFRVIVP